MSVWAIVLAAGSGSRFGGEVPKQYAPLLGRRVIDWSLETACAVADGVVLVVAADRVADPEPLADHVVAGGATRSASVRAGLAALPADCDVVLVHDGARPLASHSLYRSVIEAVRAGADGVVPGVAVTDTIKRVRGELVVETPDRDELVAVQTPQGFARDALAAAHASGADASDDAALIETTGGRVVVVPGTAANLKITHPDDLERAAAHLAPR
jgi:2-C-methyl-D-erythritol 4-phosphate cytidylyltransferase